MPLEVGQQNGRSAEVISGFGAGGEIVVHPSDRVVDGVGVAKRVARPQSTVVEGMLGGTVVAVSRCCA